MMHQPGEGSPQAGKAREAAGEAQREKGLTNGPGGQQGQARRAVSHRVHHGGRAAAGPGALARQRLPQHRAQGEDLRPGSQAGADQQHRHLAPTLAKHAGI